MRCTGDRFSTCISLPRQGFSGRRSLFCPVPILECCKRRFSVALASVWSALRPFSVSLGRPKMVFLLGTSSKNRVFVEVAYGSRSEAFTRSSLGSLGLVLVASEVPRAATHGVDGRINFGLLANVAFLSASYGISNGPKGVFWWSLMCSGASRECFLSSQGVQKW